MAKAFRAGIASCLPGVLGIEPTGDPVQGVHGGLLGREVPAHGHGWPVAAVQCRRAPLPAAGHDDDGGHGTAALGALSAELAAFEEANTLFSSTRRRRTSAAASTSGGQVSGSCTGQAGGHVHGLRAR